MSPAIDLARSFDGAWAAFQARESLRLADDSSQWQFTRGRAQYLAFLVRIEDPSARAYLTSLREQIASIAGVELYPDSYWHLTVRGVGFQVVRHSHPDDVLREDVPTISASGRDALASAPAFTAQLGLANAFADVVFAELWDGGRTRELSAQLASGLPAAPDSAIDDEHFLPHISLARFTSNDGLAQLKATLADMRAQGPGPSFTVGRVEFVRAWLSEEPSQFDTIASYQLAPARVTT